MKKSDDINLKCRIKKLENQVRDLKILISSGIKPSFKNTPDLEKDFINQWDDVRDSLPKHLVKVYKERSLDNISKIVVHHSLTESGSAEAFARYHVTTKGWPGIGYHFVIEKDGLIKWCNNLIVKSYHVGVHNHFTVGICLVGDFRKQEFDEVQRQALLKLIYYLLNKLDISYEDVLGHNQLAGYGTKECPCIDMDDLRIHLKSITNS